MPSRRLVPPVKDRARHKPRTPLQEQFQARKLRELEEVQLRAEAFLASASGISGNNQADERTDENNNMQLNDQLPQEDEGDEWENCDDERLGNIAEEGEGENGGVVAEEPLVALLNHTYNQARRLEQEQRWSKALDLMLPTYLTNRARTQNWGNSFESVKDVKATCSCEGKAVRSRTVDLVDIGSQQIFFSFQIGLFQSV